MKKIGIVIIGLIICISTALAQPRGGQRDFNPEDMAKRQTDRLDEVLDLTKDQEEQVYTLNLESGKKMRNLRNENRGDFENMREKMMEIREEQNKKMKKILTEKQWPKYEKFLEERSERMRNDRGGRNSRR